MSIILRNSILILMLLLEILYVLGKVVRMFSQLDLKIRNKLALRKKMLVFLLLSIKFVIIANQWQKTIWHH